MREFIAAGDAMREFIGHKVKVATRSLGVVEGTLVDDRKEMILVQGSDKKITRIIKQDIGAFLPTDFEPFEFVPFLVLYCENKKIPCPGVQFIKEGEGFSRVDIESFVEPCPCRCEDCIMGSKGELRSVSGKFLRGVIGSTRFGEYPKNRGQRGSSRTAGAGSGAAAPKGKGSGGGVVSGEEPAHG
jgi:hypothetical protein